MTTKTFEIDADQIVSSGGVLLYRFNDDQMELLLVNSRGGFEDFGGKIDNADKTIYKTVARETFEESNKLINKKTLESRLKTAPYVYVKRSKYVCFILEANNDESQLKSSDFGQIEIHDNIKRNVKWVKLSDFLKKEVIKYKLNWRLKSSALFSKLNEINNQRKLCDNMFR